MNRKRFPMPLRETGGLMDTATNRPTWVASAFRLAVITLTLVAFQVFTNERTGAAQLFIPAAQAQNNDDVTDRESDLIQFGASLKTDPDLEALLEKADRYRRDKNYRVATKLWQAVLQQSGDALFTQDRVTYFSLVEEVERILSTLSPEGLAAYRINADAEAQEILNTVNSPNDKNSSRRSGVDRKTALSIVVGQYFISSLGDDAAYELGSIYLDRFNFIGALRLYQKIATVYPDPSVPLEQVYLRIALCHQWLGNIADAKAAIEKAYSVADADVENLTKVVASFDQLTADSRLSPSLEVWKTAQGNAARDGVMPSPPKSLMTTDLIATWQFFTSPKDSRYDRSDHVGFVRTADNRFPESVANTVNSREEKLIRSWLQFPWRPVPSLLLDEDQLFYRSPADIIAFDKGAIGAAISGTDTFSTATPSNGKNDSNRGVGESESSAVDAMISWRSLWRNSFEIDQATRIKNAMKRSWGGYGNRRNRQVNSPTPTTNSEVQYFGDTIASQMSIFKDNLFAIEGPSYDLRNRHTPVRVNVQWNSTFRRTRDNFLTAYDRNSGHVRWRLPPTSQPVDTAPEVEGDYITAGGFMAAPIGYGNLVVVPVNSGGAIFVYAIDPDNGGKTIWKSFLCDEPEASAQPWAAIQMTISGSDLLVNCGMGVVFTLDPATGMVRLAKRYRRKGSTDKLVTRNRWNAKRMNFDGWSTDDVVSYRDQLISFTSDQDSIAALDRQTGKMIWESEYNPLGSKVDYLIGVYDDVLYAGGYETIIAYDLKGQGRILWGATQIFGDMKSRGRAMLTPAGVFVPVESTIIQYPLRSKTPNKTIQPIARVNVELGTGAPLGNLYSDGDRIYVQGANRLYALGIAAQSDDQQ